jgi:hypothetical protein
MAKPFTILEQARHDAQQLHKKISDSMAKTEAKTWADVKAVQADTLALATRMQSLAKDQADTVKTSITHAVAKMEAAGKAVESKASDARDDIKHANQALLDSAHKAANSLSEAVAEMRTKAAAAIAPKTTAKKGAS